MLGRGAEILGRPACSFAKSCGGVHGPIGVAEHFPGQEDEVGLAVGHNVIGLVWIGNHADSGGGDVGLAADPGSEPYLVARAEWDLGVGDLAAGRDIDQIDAMIAEKIGKLN